MRYFLSRDDDGHWYLVPESVRDAFSEWVEAEDGTAEPEGVVRIPGSPSGITFEAPEWYGEPMVGS